MSKFDILNDSDYESDTEEEIDDQNYDFKHITARTGEERLPKQTLRMLAKLDRIISSDKFIKLPVFKKREITKKENKSGKGEKPKKSLHSNTFKPATEKVVPKKTELDKLINRFRLSLNKITDDTYLDMRDDMFDCLDDMMKDYNEDYMKRVVNHIFETASCNRFYVNTYAKIYGEIYDNYIQMREMFAKCIDEIEILRSVRSVDPEENYDLFCEINVENEKRRSLMTFILKLCEHNYISQDFVNSITTNLVNVFKSNVDVDGKSLICEEVSELLLIIIENCSFRLSDNIMEDIDEFTEMNPKQHVSLTNKSVFKLMDIADKL
jgi:hypothetical protein